MGSTRPPTHGWRSTECGSNPVPQLYYLMPPNALVQVAGAGSADANGYFGMFIEAGIAVYYKLNGDGSKQTWPKTVSITWESTGVWDIDSADAQMGCGLYSASSDDSSRPPVDGWYPSECGAGPVPQLQYFVPSNAVLELSNAGSVEANGFYGVFEEADSLVYYKLNIDGSKQTRPYTVSITWESTIDSNQAVHGLWDIVSADEQMGCGLYSAPSDDSSRPPMEGWDRTECGANPIPQLRYFAPPTNAVLLITMAGSADANGYYGAFEENGVTAYYKVTGDGSKQTSPVSVSITLSVGVWDLDSSDDQMGCGLYSANGDGSNRPPVDGWNPTECGTVPVPHLQYLAASSAGTNALAILVIVFACFQGIHNI